MSEDRVLCVKDYARDAACWLADAIRDAAGKVSGRVTVALAGGNTPAPVYFELAHQDLPWDRLDCYYGDERCVPEDDPDSNHRMVTEHLLAPLGDRAPRVFPMDGEGDPEAAARRYEALLPAHLDLAVLGMGADGHTASLFPGASSLQETGRRVIPVTGPKPPSRRLTLTAGTLAGAGCRVLLVRGLDKAHAVAQALAAPGPDPHRPASMVRPATWILDDEAAAALDPSRVEPWSAQGEQT